MFLPYSPSADSRRLLHNTAEGNVNLAYANPITDVALNHKYVSYRYYCHYFVTHPSFLLVKARHAPKYTYTIHTSPGCLILFP